MEQVPSRSMHMKEMIENHAHEYLRVYAHLRRENTICRLIHHSLTDLLSNPRYTSSFIE